MLSDGFSNGVDEQLEWVVEAKSELRNKAKSLVDGYWAHHFKVNEGLNVWEKSALGVRVRNMEGGDFYIQWYWNEWYKDQEGKKRPLSKYIRKGKGYAYPRSALQARAKSWEIELVMSLESEFAEIRQQLRDVKLIELAMRRIKSRGTCDQPDLHSDERPNAV